MRPLAIALAENLVRLRKAMGTLNATVEEISNPGLADDEPTATPYAEDVLAILRERDALLTSGPDGEGAPSAWCRSCGRWSRT